MDFHFLVMEKSWKINVEKEGAPWVKFKQNRSPLMCISGCQHQLLATTLLSVRFRASVTLVSTSTDGDLYMRTHVQRTVSSCFAALRQLRETRRLVPSATFQSLVTNCLGTLPPGPRQQYAGRYPAYLMFRLQSVLNAAARIIFHLRRCDHITEAVMSLHWLRVPERIA